MLSDILANLPKVEQPKTVPMDDWVDVKDEAPAIELKSKWQDNYQGGGLDQSLASSRCPRRISTRL